MKLKFALALFAVAHCSAASAQSYKFTPFFSPTAGHYASWGLAVDGSGTIYATGNSAILKISSAGSATAFAGDARLPGSADGIGAAARFARPHGVALDNIGNVYVADTENHTIRKVTPAGVVTTLAGTAGLSGRADGTGDKARFSRPTGVAVDRMGNVYVADNENHAIRKITPAGFVSTLAGSLGQSGFADGEAAAARFAYPADLALDSGGNLFVVDALNKAVRKVTPDGAVTTLAKGLIVQSIAVDRGGSVYVGVGVSGFGAPVFISRITQAGTVTTLANVEDTGGLAFDRTGDLYAVNFDRGTILLGRPDANEAPALIIQPQSQTVAAGGRVTLAVSATGAPIPNFQWMKDGVALNGATDAALLITGATSQDSGSYVCAVSNSTSKLTSATARLNVVGGPLSTPEASLSNLSVRAQVAPGAPLVAGFVIGPGPAKTVLVRAVGPSLAMFGMSGALADPKLELYDNAGAKIAENDNFSPGDATTFAAVGAFALAADGKDAALVATLPPGSYTAQVSGNGGNGGVALVEIYEITSGGSRLINLSARAPVGSGGNLLISGFTIAPGTGNHWVLLRAIGTTLSAFGVSSPLSNPKLELFSGPVKLAENDNWATPIGSNAADAPTLNAAFAQSGAFPLSLFSLDAALVVELPPGNYTMQVSGADGATGIALVEAYTLASPPSPLPSNLKANVAVQSFTVIGKREGGRFIYRPLLRLVETSGAGTATIAWVEFKLEGAGVAGRVPTWAVFKRIEAGGTLDVINPNVYGDWEFEFDSGTIQADYVSVAITYLDSNNRTGSVSAITRVTR